MSARWWLSVPNILKVVALVGELHLTSNEFQEANKYQCFEHSNFEEQMMKNVFRILGPGGTQFLTNRVQPQTPGGSAEEKPSRAWGGVGVAGSCLWDDI